LHGSTGTCVKRPPDPAFPALTVTVPGRSVTLNSLANIAEVIGSIGVIISLVFVGLQIRKNTIASESATYQASVGYDIQMLMALSSDPEQAKIFNSYTWVAEATNLSDDDIVRAEYQMTALLRHLENLYLQHKLGMLSDEIWRTRQALLDAIVMSPGYERFQNTASAQTFDGAFRHYAAELRADHASGGS
jgi:hypothetical protein